MNATNEELNSLAQFYNQARRRRRKVVRALAKVERQRPELESIGDWKGLASSDRWLMVYGMRLTEVNLQILDIENRDDFYKIHPRAVGLALAPVVLLTGGLVALGAIIGGVVSWLVAVL